VSLVANGSLQLNASNEYQSCPVCNERTGYSERYPFHLCKNCLADGAIVDGNVVPIEQLKLDILSDPIIYCVVKGVNCIAQEAHFGGLVVNAEKQHQQFMKKLKQKYAIKRILSKIGL
jgi:hypothetical protein